VARCTVSRLTGGPCQGEPFVVTIFHGESISACDAHQHLVSPVLAVLEERRRTKQVSCPHRHATREARSICEARMRRVAR
jgi:hypothetical protein